MLDHTRTVFMTVMDGSLPSNVGGGGNVRNVLRRVFGTLKKNKWMDILKMEGNLLFCFFNLVILLPTLIH